MSIYMKIVWPVLSQFMRHILPFFIHTEDLTVGMDSGEKAMPSGMVLAHKWQLIGLAEVDLQSGSYCRHMLVSEHSMLGWKWS